MRYVLSKAVQVLGVSAFLAFAPSLVISFQHDVLLFLLVPAVFFSFLFFFQTLKVECSQPFNFKRLMVLILSVLPYLLLLSFVSVPNLLLVLILVFALCDAFDSSTNLLPTWSVYCVLAFSFVYTVQEFDTQSNVIFLIFAITIIGFETLKKLQLPEADVVLTISLLVIGFSFIKDNVLSIEPLIPFIVSLSVITLGSALTISLSSPVRLYALFSFPAAFLLISQHLQIA
jgi:hypothetical protein